MILVQARSNSTRLPMKWDKKIGDKTVLEHLIGQLQGFPFMFCIPYDDELKKVLEDKFIPFFEGFEKDVVGRLYRCAKTYGLKRIVRVTGDCPFLDPAQLLYIYQNGERFDYLSNCLNDTTDGQECESISFKLLEYIHLNHISEEDREHVTYTLRKNPRIKDFTFGAYKPFIKGPKISIDTEEDLENLNRMYKEYLER